MGNMRYSKKLKPLNYLPAIFISLFMSAQLGCAQKEIDYKAADKLEKNKEFETLVTIKEIDPPPAAAEPPAETKAPAPEAKKADVKAEPKKEEKKKAEKAPTPPKKAANETTKTSGAAAKDAATKPMKREPELEDSEGFNGRRPVVDPYRLGESVTLSLNYFNITAGTMELSVDPFVEVNGKKAYTFGIRLKSNTMFSRFYAVDDHATTHVDFETLVPYDHQISVKESKQVRNIKSYFNFKKGEAQYWETKVTKDKGEEKKKKTWKILPYSQNVVSALFYLRAFQLTPGKKIEFRLAEDGKNIVCTIDVLRKEKLKTEIGVLNTVVIQPKIAVDGVFKPVGDVFFWLTDDDRKFPVRIESEIKIGTIVAKLKKINR